MVLGPKNFSISPIAQKTLLGWILTREVKYKECLQIDQHSGFCVDSYLLQEDLSISEAINKFWEIEKISVKKFSTQEEEDCEKHFETKIFRQDDGRYGVRLPFKIEPKFQGS